MFKVKIRSPRAFNSQGATEFNDQWPFLEKAIFEIFDGRTHQLSFEKLYNVVYGMVLRRNGAELYENVRATLRSLMIAARTGELARNDPDLLEKLVKVWEKQCESLQAVSDVMMYLDRVFCKENRQLLIFDMGLELFRDEIVKPLNGSVKRLFIENLNEVRLQRSEAKLRLLKSTVSILESLSKDDDTYYVKELEPHILTETTNYYDNFVKSHRYTPSQYLSQIRELFELENQLDTEILNKDTTVKVRNAMKDVLITKNSSFIIDQGLPAIIEAEDLESLSLLFELCEKSSDRANLLKTLSKRIIDEGSAIKVEDNLKKRAIPAIKWVLQVLRLKEKYNGILSAIGQDKLKTASSVDAAFSLLLNHHHKKTAEFLSTYIDSVLRSAEESRVPLLDEAIGIFKLLKDKDVFEKIYKQQLSKRLLQDRSQLELEKHMIEKMKQEIGASFTSKMEGMIRDLLISKGYEKKFRQDYTVPVNFKANVLTTTCWPFRNTDSFQDIQLPETLERLKLDFENFFIKSHTGRTLRWAYHLGSMDIGCQFAKDYYVISMSVYAATVLLLFETHSQLTTEEIADLTCIPSEELTRQLFSISVPPKTRILKKRPMNKNIAPTDIFTFNHDFTAATKAIKISTVFMKGDSSLQGLSSLQNPIQEAMEDRKLLIDALVVRELKVPRSIKERDLFVKVQTKLANKFELSPKLLSESLARLIDREYVQRDSEDTACYHYLP
ncbi:LAMI_0D05622g1_1 [Lachancea mirantina]|uniref:LAMI_0D05622g1_1 n=1 Tax=Lachancea mirantina TaxID=1230905 RepID=A0A1G4JB92_9SACH|nr:LAMI_0D05622g1_1 [Lachancea mirantina]